MRETSFIPPTPGDSVPNSRLRLETSVNARHFVIRRIERGHAINPGIHVAPVEAREPEDPIEFVVERVPVVDIRALDAGERDYHCARIQE